MDDGSRYFVPLSDMEKVTISKGRGDLVLRVRKVILGQSRQYRGADI